MGTKKKTATKTTTKPAPTKKPAKAAAKTSAATTASDSPTVEGSQADYQKFLPAALALDARDVVPYRTDASLAYHNVSVAVASLLAKGAAARALPNTDVDALSLLPSQCLAVAFAVEQAAQASGTSSGAIGPQLARASVLRKNLFVAADALVAAGLFPAKPMAVLHAGTGRIDTANDLVGLAALFKANAVAIKGKTAITAADTSEAATLGTTLLTLLKPRAAKKARTNDAVQTSDTRDRLWTLVEQGYASLWSACAYLYGPNEIAARVPPLGARVATTSARKTANAAKKAAKAAAPKAPPT